MWEHGGSQAAGLRSPAAMANEHENRAMASAGPKAGEHRNGCEGQAPGAVPRCLRRGMLKGGADKVRTLVRGAPAPVPKFGGAIAPRPRLRSGKRVRKATCGGAQSA